MATSLFSQNISSEDDRREEAGSFSSRVSFSRVLTKELGSRVFKT